ncbi:hypothetical protein Golomagni_07741 [Golovinomyces magnicellulatus]|nr:hypothetical protein Golomagni_07741 [Golovinomyces magnicellulatus]
MSENPGQDGRRDQREAVMWSKPMEEQDQQRQTAEGTNSKEGSRLSEAVSMIKKEDFTNIANTPCSRNGFLTGIGAGAGLGGLRFVLRGGIQKSANWAVGFFLVGSIASYEYCQYQRRAERISMKRHIEVVTQNQRQKAKDEAEKKIEKERFDLERKAAEKRWYKFW